MFTKACIYVNKNADKKTILEYQKYLEINISDNIKKAKELLKK